MGVATQADAVYLCSLSAIVAVECARGFGGILVSEATMMFEIVCWLVGTGIGTAIAVFISRKWD